MFPDDKTAEEWFVNQRWPNGVHCSYCESDNVSEEAKHPTRPFFCNECRKYFSAKTHSVMHRSKLGYRKWAIAICLTVTSIKGISSTKLHRDIDVTKRTASHMLHRIRETYSLDNPRGNYLTRKGYANLRAEEKRLQSRLVQLRKATGETQPRESKVKKNAEFSDLQEKQSRVISKLRQIRAALQSAKVVDLSESKLDYVKFGSTVVLRELGGDELEEYQIVGSAESNPRCGKISIESPIGSAVFGEKKSSTVKVRTPKGISQFTILDIKME